MDLSEYITALPDSPDCGTPVGDTLSTNRALTPIDEGSVVYEAVGGEEHEVLLRRMSEEWNDKAVQVFADAILDLFETAPDEMMACAITLLRQSPYWTEQVARAILGLPSDETGEYELFSHMLDNRCVPSERTSETWLTSGF